VPYTRKCRVRNSGKSKKKSLTKFWTECIIKTEGGGGHEGSGGEQRFAGCS
jgi:hypothetical protein